MAEFNNERFAARESVLNTIVGAALGSNLISEANAQNVAAQPTTMPSIATIAGGGVAFLLAALLMVYIVYAARRVAHDVAERKRVLPRFLGGYAIVAVALIWLPGVVKFHNLHQCNVPLLYIVITWLPLYALVGLHSRKEFGGRHAH